MGFKTNMLDLFDYLSYQKRESTVRAKLIKKHLKQENEQVEYYKFKRAVLEKINEQLYMGDNTKIVIKPTKGFEYMYDLLEKDEDFIRFYIGETTITGELEVSLRPLQQII